ncbi:MAG: GNAT family N-acetyltransferase [Flavobacteriaceae bacterium]|nr:GNAT family N-acetyltransferase [Flavobacteriaceae bacterium]
MIYKNKKLIALLPANVANDNLFSHQGLTYGSFIYDAKLKTTEYISCFRTVLEYLNKQNIKSLQLKELPFFYLKNQVNNPLYYLLFKTKAELVRTDVHSVVDMVFKSYSSSRKEGVKRGLKHNLRVKESESFDLFWNKILKPNLKAKHDVLPVHSLEEITLLKSRFPNNIRQFNVFYENKIVGGVTIFETNNVAHCQYISGNADKNELGSLDFLHHHLIEDVFKTKSYFDFGTSNINSGENINEGLQFWKEGFGARAVNQGFYKIDTENYKLLDNILI